MGFPFIHEFRHFVTPKKAFYAPSGAAGKALFNHQQNCGRLAAQIGQTSLLSLALQEAVAYKTGRWFLR